MIEYTTIEEEGTIRACFNQGSDYFEIPLVKIDEDGAITPIPENEIQSHLNEQINLLAYPRTDDEEAINDTTN